MLFWTYFSVLQKDYEPSVNKLHIRLSFPLALCLLIADCEVTVTLSVHLSFVLRTVLKLLIIRAVSLKLFKFGKESCATKILPR